MNILTNQVSQIIGAVLILGAFAGAQAGWLRQKSRAYLLPNLIGSAALAGAAIPTHQWGFLLLEGTWAFTSLAALVTTIARPAANGQPTETNTSRKVPWQIWRNGSSPGHSHASHRSFRISQPASAPRARIG